MTENPNESLLERYGPARTPPNTTLIYLYPPTQIVVTHQPRTKDSPVSDQIPRTATPNRRSAVS
jgi:hypothetical protein